MNPSENKDYADVWVALALINAGLAETKNRGRLNWFLLSCLLGPLATFLIVYWDRPKSSK